MIPLFSPLKYFLGGSIGVSGGLSGILYYTDDFLKTTSQLPGSLTGSSDMGKFWYIASMRRASYIDGFVKYLVSPEFDTKNGVDTDIAFTLDIYRKCKQHKNTVNFLFNKRYINSLKDWCFLENELVDDKFSEIFRWEYKNRCRLIFKDDSNNDSNNDSDKQVFFWKLLNKIWEAGTYETEKTKLEKIYEKFNSEKNSGCPSDGKWKIYKWKSDSSSIETSEETGIIDTNDK